MLLLMHMEDGIFQDNGFLFLVSSSEVDGTYFGGSVRHSMKKELIILTLRHNKENTSAPWKK